MPTSRLCLSMVAGAVLSVMACGRSSTSVSGVAAPERETAGLSITPASAMLRIGDTLRFSIPRTSYELTTPRWRSSNPGVLSVDSLLGLATARETGASTVQVQQAGCAVTMGSGSVSVIP